MTRHLLLLGLLLASGAAAAERNYQVLASTCRGDSAASDVKHCTAAKPATCACAGVALVEGVHVKADGPKARALLKLGCDGDDARSCYDLGTLHLNGVGGPVDAATGRALVEKACAAHFAVACGLVGALDLESPDASTQRLGTDLLSQACGADEWVSCVNLGLAHQRGLGIPKDLDRALDYFQRACDGGNSSGCFRAAAIYDEGDEGKKDKVDKAQALECYRKACDATLNPRGDACWNLAMMNKQGDGVPRDITEATRLVNRACKLGIARACDMLGKPAAKK